MLAHDYMKDLGKRKLNEELVGNLKEIANKDFELFMKSASEFFTTKGFKMGLKVGFWLGIITAVLLYLIFT